MQVKNTVTDNNGLDNADNFYLTNGLVITVTGSLKDSKIGISMQTPDILTSGYSTYNQGVVPAACFESGKPATKGIYIVNGKKIVCP